LNIQHVSNTASIKLNSNVVTEFPRSKKLIKYPRVALTQNDESATSGYVASASNENTGAQRYAYKAFDNNIGSKWQMSGTNNSSAEGYDLTPPYDANSNSPTITDNNGNDHTGAWVKLQIPEAIKISSMYIYAPTTNRRPDSAVLLGSNDNSTWYVIKETFTVENQDENTISVSTSSYYEYVMFLVKSLTGNEGQLQISELEYFGVPEYDPDAAGIDVKVTSYPNVPNTDWLGVYYDAKNLVDGAVTSVDDLTPSGTNDGTATNVTVSDGAFVFNGTSSLLEKTSLSIPGGDNPFTFSFWLKNDTFDTTQYILRLGDNQTMNQTAAIYKTSSNQIVFATWTLDFPINYIFTSNRWNHISLMYPGGGWEQSNLIAYVDGKRFNFNDNISSGGTGGNAMTLATSLTLRLGGFSTGNTHLDGSIANFRLFNRAITSDEIWQLYAYQKEYFGHGDLSMTLKAGRLNVKGDISCDGVVKPYTCAFAAYASSGGDSSTTGIFPADSVYFNIGNCYNTSTYVFTAPVHGIYHMSFSAFTNQGASTTSRIFARINDTNVEQVGATIEDHGNSLSLTVEMQAGDTFHFRGGGSTPIYYFGAGGHNRFCGHLICAL